MSERLPITKTYKLAIGGKFPRTESGRTTRVTDQTIGIDAHVCHASRKDLRSAVEAAHSAYPAWSGATAYLRSQILYRLAEMMEGKRAELASALGDNAQAEVNQSIDRVIHYAGWADKYPQILGGSNPVAGPYHNFTIPGPMGVVAVIAPDAPALLGLITLLAPVLAVGNTTVVLASETNPIPAMILAEALATSDLPPGVVNTLTGFRDELAPHTASHHEIIAVHAAGLSESQRTTLREGAAENLKRVTTHPDTLDFTSDEHCESPSWIDPFVEFKTIWHPSAV